MGLFDLNGNVPLHKSEHSLDDEFLRQSSIENIIEDNLLQLLVHLCLEFLNVLVSGLHPLDTMAIMEC
jgi:hypothetical protein